MRYKRPDKKNAVSIVEAASSDMKFTLTLKPSDEAGPTIVRNIYESFRKLGEAILILRGIRADDHIAPIKELTSLSVKTSRPLALIDQLRKRRHNINYYGYRPTQAEIEDAISIADSCFKPIVEEIKRRII